MHRAKSGRNFAIGAGYLFIFLRPDGTRVVRFLPRAPIGFRAGQKNANPITNPIINPISNPMITAVNHTYIHMLTTRISHISYTILPFYHKRILFCTGLDVNFDFFLHPTTTGVSSMVAPPLSFTGIQWKIPHFNGQKVGLNNKRVIGLPENPPRF